jgi:hypothetical protein
MLNCTIILQVGDNSGAQEAAADSQWFGPIGLDGIVYRLASPDATMLRQTSPTGIICPIQLM